MRITSRVRKVLPAESLNEVMQAITTLKKNTAVVEIAVRAFQETFKKSAQLLAEIEGRMRLLKTFGDLDQLEFIIVAQTELDKLLLKDFPLVLNQVSPYIVVKAPPACESLRNELLEIKKLKEKIEAEAKPRLKLPQKLSEEDPMQPSSDPESGHDPII
jgi:hypothetical protein